MDSKACKKVKCKHFTERYHNLMFKCRPFCDLNDEFTQYLPACPEGYK